nr:hypothetical protein [Thermoplasma volcanium]
MAAIRPISGNIAVKRVAYPLPMASNRDGKRNIDRNVGSLTNTYAKPLAVALYFEGATMEGILTSSSP